MATAVRPSTAAPQSNSRLGLAVASLFAALVVIAGFAAAVYGLPEVWGRLNVNNVLGAGLTAVLARLLIQIALVAVFVWVASVFAGVHPPRGLRGGIFIAISAIVTVFFIVRAVGMNLEPMGGFGLPVTAAVLAGLLYGIYLLLTSPRIQECMVAIENQGWFHTFSYKRTQGLRARRYTLIGLLIIGWSGAYSLYTHATVGSGTWQLPVPFTGYPQFRMVVLTDVEIMVPLLLG